MLNAVEGHITYVPFPTVKCAESVFRFRLLNPAREDRLKDELIKWGQLHPVTVEEAAPNEFNVLDGHRRCDAVARIRENGSWEKIMVHVLPAEKLTLQEKFQLLKDRNFKGDNAYGLYEKGLFLKTFHERGLAIKEMAGTAEMAPKEVEQFVELAKMPLAVGKLVNEARLSVSLALILGRRIQEWLKTPYVSHVDAIVKDLLDAAAREDTSPKAWQFLLDFYWNGPRPFMAPPKKDPK